MIYQHDGNCFSFAERPALHGGARPRDIEGLPANTMQQFESAVNRLGDPVKIQQSETAVKRNRGEIIFIENIAECPKAEALWSTPHC